MRLLLKLSTAVMCAVAMQWMSAGMMGWLDEVQFLARSLYADVTGEDPDSPELIDAADRLKARQVARLMYRSDWSIFEPVLAWQHPPLVPMYADTDSS